MNLRDRIGNLHLSFNRKYTLKFKSADEFLTALTRELILHGTKSDKISWFLCVASDKPEWDELAKIAIDLRSNYEKHSQK